MTSGAAIARPKLLDGHAAERALVEVERAGQHPGERHGQLVLGRDARFVPLIIFQVHHALVRQQVGIRPLQPGRCGNPVERDGQVVRGGLLDGTAEEVDHLLIVAVHEVEHHPFDAPLVVERERPVHVGLGRPPVHPEADLDALGRGVTEHLAEVEARDAPGDVAPLVRD